jgi:hypothetical protein
MRRQALCTTRRQALCTRLIIIPAGPPPGMGAMKRHRYPDRARSWRRRAGPPRAGSPTAAGPLTAPRARAAPSAPASSALAPRGRGPEVPRLRTVRVCLDAATKEMALRELSPTCDRTEGTYAKTASATGGPP